MIMFPKYSRDVMDHEYFMINRGLSFVDFRNGKLPMRCLDLGCGVCTLGLRYLLPVELTTFLLHCDVILH